MHVDHLQRPIMMTNAAKVNVWAATWLPFGGAHSITGSAANDNRFPGQWFQAESGLHYNWHRHYDPTTGRYTQADPLGLVDAPSVYAYGYNNPQMNVDADGRSVLRPYRFLKFILPLLLPPPPTSQNYCVAPAAPINIDDLRTLYNEDGKTTVDDLVMEFLRAIYLHGVVWRSVYGVLLDLVDKMKALERQNRELR